MFRLKLKENPPEETTKCWTPARGKLSTFDRLRAGKDVGDEAYHLPILRLYTKLEKDGFIFTGVDAEGFSTYETWHKQVD